MTPLYTDTELYTDFSELSLLLVVQPVKMGEAGAEFVNHQVWMIQSMINDILGAKYLTPFAPVPSTVKFWIARIISPKIIERIGVDPTEAMYLRFVEDAKLAWEEIRAEASSEDINLPLPPIGETTSTSGLAAGYTQYDPKTWYRVQADRARDERDRGRGGTVL
ncbi:MAG: hypothetical protein ACOYBP_08905 [Microbacteriaceae bacterium]